MSDSQQEISTDYDLDHVDDPLADCDTQKKECDSLDQEIEQLLEIMSVVDDHGLSAPSVAVLKRSSLLAGTAVDLIAVESFQVSRDDNPESDMAMEALVDSIKEKMASWGAKILSFVKNACSKIVSVLDAVKDKIVGGAKVLLEKGWDATKAAGRTIKAHPFKTVMACLAAVGVVAAIVVLTAAPGSYAGESSVKSTMTKVKDMINTIKSPFGTVTAEVVTKEVRTFEVYEVATKTTKTMSYEIPTATVQELGWSQSAIKSVMLQFNKVWGSIRGAVGGLLSTPISLLKKLNSTTGDEAKTIISNKVAGKTKSKLTGWIAGKWVERMYAAAFMSLTGVVVNLIRSVAIKAFNAVSETFGKLKQPEPAKA